MESDEHDVWLNTVELVFGRVRITKLKAIDYLKRFDVVISTLAALFEVPDDGQTVYWITFKTALDHSAFLERHGAERSVKLGDLDVKVACSDKSLHYRDVLLSKIPPNFNIEVVKTVLKNYGQITKCEWEVYVDRAMGDLVGCKTGFLKIRMVVDKHIPSYLNIGPHRSYVTYRGQPITCRGCDARGHTWYNCPSRRRRRGPAGGEGSNPPSIPGAPPRPNPPAPTRSNPPNRPAPHAQAQKPSHAEPRAGGQPPAAEQLGWTEVTQRPKRANSGRAPEESALKTSRANSDGAKVAQMASEPAPASEDPSSSRALENMRDFPPLLADNLYGRSHGQLIYDEAMDAYIGEIVTPTTHVSETQASVTIGSDASGTTSQETAADGHPPQPSGDRTDADKRPPFPSLSSTLMPDLNALHY